MARWLNADCPQCGPFWARQGKNRKVESCSRCGHPLPREPVNLIYSDDDLLEEEDCSPQMRDFDTYCRSELITPDESKRKRSPYLRGRLRRPTIEDISDRGEFAALEVEHHHEIVEKLFGYYRELKNRDPQERAWCDYWRTEYRHSEDRLGRMRRCFEKIRIFLRESGFPEDFIRRDMNDLYTSEWSHNWRITTDKGKEWARRWKRLRALTRDTDHSDDEPEEGPYEDPFRVGHTLAFSNFDELRDSYPLRKTEPLEELAQETMGCLDDMEEYRGLLKKEVKEYRPKVPSPVCSQTRIHWRKAGRLVHLTLSHPQPDGTETIEVVGTGHKAIRHACPQPRSHTRSGRLTQLTTTMPTIFLFFAPFCS
jgi:hypothetical protein